MSARAGFRWVSERHLRVELGSDTSIQTHRRVRAAYERLRAAGIPALRDLTPAYATVLLSFDALLLDAVRAESEVAGLLEGLENAAEAGPSRLVEIPVCYEGECAPDIESVAAAHGLRASEVVELHSGAEYVVSFVGFVPGFAYLGGLPARLAMPRLERPRVHLPAGSVGIAGEQTGVYPFATAGGWRLVGRTPLRVFDPARERPGMMEMGDRVRFVPIGIKKFQDLADSENAGIRTAGPGLAPPDRSSSSPSAGGIRVIDPGMLTTVQDLGREGWASAGAPVGGAADPLSLRMGNRLVGNEDGAAGLEMTLIGSLLEFEDETVVALVGGDVKARIEGSGGANGGRAIDMNAAEQVQRGGRLRVGPVRNGARVYLCVGGGVRTAHVMGSSSTHLAVGMGGFDGRALRTGDRVEVGNKRIGNRLNRRTAGGSTISPANAGKRTLRILINGAGFAASAVEMLLRTEYKVLAQSDRVGLRLEGAPIPAPGGGRMISEGMMWGAVQVPENGKPIILMSEHPTTGGYPAIGCVAQIDLPALGQLRPGDAIRFERVETAWAREMLRDSERVLDASLPRVR